MLFVCLFVLFFGTGCYSLAQAGLELLPQFHASAVF